MAELLIRPYESFGPVAFGRTRQELEQQLGEPDKPFPTEEMNREKFYYDALGIRVDFDANGLSAFVEALDLDVALPVVKGVPLRGRIDDVVGALGRLGHHPITDPVGVDIGTLFFLGLGVALWREDDHEPDIDTVAGWRRGYYIEHGFTYVKDSG